MEAHVPPDPSPVGAAPAPRGDHPEAARGRVEREDGYGSPALRGLVQRDHEGAASAGPLQVLQEFVAPSRIADALFEQRCSDLKFSSSQMAEHLNIRHSVTFANGLDRILAKIPTLS